SSRSFYNSKPWSVMREFVYHRDYGLCVQCRRKGIIKIGDVVDHAIPLLVDWLRRLDPNNLQTLCHACHNKKTKEEEKKYRR
ncbi:HNH endonuclease, partial [Bacillus thuringiensis]|uniref:HNH endonuclease n=1 Tax=Bacillus thuringiensis TaxID=1428 RepID=UPI0021003CAC